MKISLLSALPHSISDIEEARDNHEKDYIRNNLKGFFVSSQEIWLAMENSLGKEAHSLFEFCKEHNVSVYQHAGIKQLKEAASQSDIVIILAHWKGPYISVFPSDILTSIEKLDTFMDKCINYSIIKEDTKRLVHEAVSNEKAKEILAQKLNIAIKNWRFWVKFDTLIDGKDSLVISDSYGRNYARSVINGIFGRDYLIPGSRIELNDGLWNPSEIAECFGEDWHGVCDFACCTSAYLAEETWCQHPKALFRADARLLYPELIIPATREIINRLTAKYQPRMQLAEMYMSVAYECDKIFGG